MPIVKNLDDNGAVEFALSFSGKRTLFLYGSFGGGTASVTVSPDGGDTDVPVKDQDGNPVTLTADGQVRLELDSEAATPILLTVTLAGATTPDLNVRLVEQGVQPWKQ